MIGERLMSSVNCNINFNLPRSSHLLILFEKFSFSSGRIKYVLDFADRTFANLLHLMKYLQFLNINKKRWCFQVACIRRWPSRKLALVYNYQEKMYIFICIYQFSDNLLIFPFSFWIVFVWLWIRLAGEHLKSLTSDILFCSIHGNV